MSISGFSPFDDPRDVLRAGPEVWSQFCDEYIAWQERLKSGANEGPRQGHPNQSFSVCSMPKDPEYCLHGVDLSGMNLSGYDFRKAELTKVTANRTDFEGSQFLYPPELKFDPATPPNLRGVTIDGARFNEMYEVDVAFGSDGLGMYGPSLPFLRQLLRDNPGRDTLTDMAVQLVVQKWDQAGKGKPAPADAVPRFIHKTPSFRKN